MSSPEPFTVHDVERAADWCAVGNTPVAFDGEIDQFITVMLRALAERMRVEQAATHRRCGSCGRQDVLPIAASWTNCPCGSSWFIIGEPPHDPDALTGEYRTAGTTNVTIPLGPPYGASSTPDVLAARDAEIAALTAEVSRLESETLDLTARLHWAVDYVVGATTQRDTLAAKARALLNILDGEYISVEADALGATLNQLAQPTTERQP